jgi:hypothetical protein
MSKRTVAAHSLPWPSRVEAGQDPCHRRLPGIVLFSALPKTPLLAPPSYSAFSPAPKPPHADCVLNILLVTMYAPLCPHTQGVAPEQEFVRPLVLPQAPPSLVKSRCSRRCSGAFLFSDFGTLFEYDDVFTASALPANKPWP